MNRKNQIVMYLIFGILTTLINILCYAFLREYLHINYIFSTTIAWILSVIFAFITNKKYVFNSNFTKVYSVLHEFISFIFFRLVSLGMDLGMMIVLVDLIKLDDYFAKITANILVVIINYIVSKYIVFKKKPIKS